MSDQVISTAVTTFQQTDANGGTLTILPTGSVIPAIGTALVDNFDNATITIGGLVSGNAGASMQGGPGGVLKITSTGTLFGYGLYAALLTGDDTTFINDGSAYGEFQGINVQFNPAYITNNGTIQGNRDAGIYFNGQNSSTEHTLSNSGLIEGLNGIDLDSSQLSASNSGRIIGRDYGIITSEDQTPSFLTLSNSGIIEGASIDGIRLVNAADIVNSGRITGLGKTGIRFLNDESVFGQLANVTNSETGVIEGLDGNDGAAGISAGIDVRSMLVTLDNAGEITGKEYGVYLNNDEEVFGVTADVQNSGRILGQTVAGMYVDSYQTTSIISSGEISSVQGLGILVENTLGDPLLRTLVDNSGSISGSLGAISVIGTAFDLANTGTINSTSSSSPTVIYSEGNEDLTLTLTNEGEIRSLSGSTISSDAEANVVNSGSITADSNVALSFANANERLGQTVDIANLETGVIGSTDPVFIGINVSGYSLELNNLGTVISPVQVAEINDTGGSPIAATADILNAGTMFGSAPLISKVSTRVVNTGLMEGEFYGLFLDADRDGGFTAQIQNDGQIIGTANDAVFIEDMTADIFNNGLISGYGDGIEVRESAAALAPALVVNTGVISSLVGIGVDLESSGKLVNSGTVQGATAVQMAEGNDVIENTGDIFGFIDLGNGENRIDNSGNIQGDVLLGTDDDVVYNAGAIMGDVTLGDGNDFFDGLGVGVVGGTIFGGDGDDTIQGTQANASVDGGTGNDLILGAGEEASLSALNFVDVGPDEFIF